MGLFKTIMTKDKSKLIRKEKAAKVRMMSINNTNHFLTGKNSHSLVSDIFNSGKKKNGGTKLQQYKQNATINFNDWNEALSSTTDKRTTDERVESYRTMNNRTLKNTKTHREVQERKVLQQIEEVLEREYKFYQVKTKK